MNATVTDTNALICRHCEERPVFNGLGLCEVCNQVRGIRRLYFRTRNYTEEKERRIHLYTRRAKLRLPLFTTFNPEEN